jgi:hypothetical protein
MELFPPKTDKRFHLVKRGLEFCGQTGAAEKLATGSERRTSGPKGHIDLMMFMPGINPRSTLKQSFSAACEAVPHSSGDFRGLESP